MNDLKRNGLVVYSEDEIEKIVRLLPTSTRRINARKRLRKSTNLIIDRLIAQEKELLRSLRSESESAKRSVYARISQYEQLKHEV